MSHDSMTHSPGREICSRAGGRVQAQVRGAATEPLGSVGAVWEVPATAWLGGMEGEDGRKQKEMGS